MGRACEGAEGVDWERGEVCGCKLLHVSGLLVLDRASLVRGRGGGDRVLMVLREGIAV